MNLLQRRIKLETSRLYLCTGIRDGGADLERFLDAVLSNGGETASVGDGGKEYHAEQDLCGVGPAISGELRSREDTRKFLDRQSFQIT